MRTVATATLLASSMALRLESATVVIPHPAKAATGGEDAWFALRRHTFGVFDGVGGWADEGVDPGLFSRAFARGTVDALIEQEAARGAGEKGQRPGGIDLERALTTGLAGVREIGTSTACLLNVNADGRLQVSSDQSASASGLRGAAHRLAHPAFASCTRHSTSATRASGSCDSAR